MTKYVEWVEPYSDGAETLFLRMSFADIASARRRAEPRYESDEQAVEDFLIVHWGKIVELPDEP